MQKIEDANEKLIKELKERMTKKKSLSWHKKKVWTDFSKYFRLKNSDKNGYCTCYTCGKKAFWKDGMQAGHLLDGRNNSILYYEDCIRVQCVSCNRFKAGLKEVYIPRYIDEHGRDKYDEMVRLKHTTKRFSREELKEMREYCKDKIKEFKKEKGLI